MPARKVEKEEDVVEYEDITPEVEVESEKVGAETVVGDVKPKGESEGEFITRVLNDLGVKGEEVISFSKKPDGAVCVVTKDAKKYYWGRVDAS